MRVFVAGATGAVGGRLVPILVAKIDADPLDPAPLAEFRATLNAIRHLESTVAGTAGFEGRRPPIRRGSTVRVQACSTGHFSTRSAAAGSR